MGLYEECIENIPENFFAELELRNQDQALKKIVEKIECGEKVIVYEGRTGVGKSLINYSIAKTLGKEGGSFYLSPQVKLVAQIAKEKNFLGTQRIVGKGNYACNIKKDLTIFPLRENLKYKSRENGKEILLPISNDWTKQTAPCSIDSKGFNYAELNLAFGCGMPKLSDSVTTCPYAVDMIRANNANMVIATIDLYLSSHYLIKPRKVMVIDEAHKLEGCVEKYLGLNFSFESLSKNFSAHGKKFLHPKRIDECIPVIIEYLGNLNYDFQELENSLKAMLDYKSKELEEFQVKYEEIEKLYKKKEAVSRNIQKIQSVLDDVDNFDFFETRQGFALKPKSFKDFFEKKFLNHELVIISTATLPRPYSYFEKRFGLDGIAPIILPAIFDSRRNPIYVPVLTSVNKGNQEQIIKENSKYFAEIMLKHSGQRGIVGCVSGKLVKDIVDNLQNILPKEQFDRIIFYTSANDLIGNRKAQDYCFEKYLEKNDSVLIATSLEEGHDLYDDRCRFIIVPKVPFLDLGDKEIAKKKDIHGQAWYSGQAAEKLVQLSGRGMRSISDYCVVYVLDGAFLHLLRKDEENDWGLFPNDFKQAVHRLDDVGHFVKFIENREYWIKCVLDIKNLNEFGLAKDRFVAEFPLISRTTQEKEALLETLVFFDKKQEELELLELQKK